MNAGPDLRRATVGDADIAAEVYLRARHHAVPGRALTLYLELDDRAGEAVVLINLGEIYVFRGRWQEGIDLLQQALMLGREINDPLSVGGALESLAEIECKQGWYQEAEDHAREALAVARQASLPTGEARTLTVLAAICHRQGRHVLAAGYCQQALAMHREFGNRPWEVEALNILGQTLLATGQPKKPGSAIPLRWTWPASSASWTGRDSP